MKLQNLLIAILLMGLFSISCITYINSLKDRYGYNADLSALNGMENITKVQMDRIEKVQIDATNFTLELGALNVIYVPYKMIQVAWDSVKVLFGSVPLMVDSIFIIGSQLSETLGIDPMVFGVIIVLITLMLIIILIYALFKWEFRS